MVFARIAALVYVLWAILHLYAAYGVYNLGTMLEPGMVQGRIFQDAWNLVFFALFGGIVGIIYVWRNSRMGYWLNFLVVGISDVGFVVTILIPGHIPIMPGIIGPLLWIIAAALSTIAISRYSNAQSPTSSISSRETEL